MRRIPILIVAALCCVGFRWAVPDVSRETVLTAMEQAVPNFGFRGPGSRGTVDNDTVTVQQHDRFTPAQRAALVAVFNSLGIAHGDSIVGFVPYGDSIVGFVPFPLKDEP